MAPQLARQPLAFRSSLACRPRVVASALPGAAVALIRVYHAEDAQEEAQE